MKVVLAVQATVVAVIITSQTSDAFSPVVKVRFYRNSKCGSIIFKR